MEGYTITRLFKNCQREPDEYDKGMVDVYVREWNSHFKNDPTKPRVGDFILTPEGKYLRVAYIWPDLIQTCESGSFYLGCGSVSMSGGLDPGYPPEKLALMNQYKEGTFWTFHHDSAFAHNGIGISCACRVFKVI